MVHIRYDGKSYDLHEAVLGIRVGDSDAEIKMHVARYLDVARDRLERYAVDRSPNGNVIVRPEAVYG